MKPKITVLIVGLIIAAFLPFSSCKRSAVEEPSPVGPSTYAVLLNVSASPNVLFAGSFRETTTITAVLKKFDGAALANETVHFDVRDADGSRSNFGYLEGQQSVVTRTTDSNGYVTLNYYGPIAQEITGDSTVHIYATVAWQGKEFIAEFTPVYIIRDVIDIALDLTANPNVILATSKRPESKVIAVATLVNGVPLVGRRVYFSILSGPGKFSNGKRKANIVTNASGVASITYIGPKTTEITKDTSVEVRAHLETSTPDWLHKEVFIYVIKGQ